VRGEGDVEMRSIVAAVVIATLLSAFAGCAPQASADEVRSSLARETPVALPEGDLAALVAGNNAFAFDLYRQVADGSDNLFYSPYSISLALAMTYAGARGVTEEEMSTALHFDLPGEALHTAFNALDQELRTRGRGAAGKDEEGFRLNVVNAIWGQRDYAFRSDFLNVLARNYGAGLRVLDFQTAPEPSRTIINEWVQEQTEDRIKDLLPQGAVDSLTRLVLTNAVYFNAAWQSQFQKEFTTPGQFHLLNGSDVSVPMMQQRAAFGYVRAGNFEALELPYDGRELSMVILLPSVDQFEAFEGGLDYSVVAGAINALDSTQVEVTMPRFKLETSLKLSGALSDLGMAAAFDAARADFSGMDGSRSLYITDVVHKAFVDVDESGTEAAAATAVVVGTTSIPAEPVRFTVDRPFLFLIRDVGTGTILFLGRVMDPA